MFPRVLFAALALVVPADDMKLEASVSSGSGKEYEFSSTPTKDNGVLPKYSITDTVTNYCERRIRFELDKDEGGVIAAVVKRGNATVPRSITMVRTTYRRFVEADGSLTIVRVNGNLDSSFNANRWLEANQPPATAHPGAKLEAELIDGGPTGRVLVRCVSEVTGDKEKGYKYTLTIENLSTDAVSFKLAGRKGLIEAKQTFTKSESFRTLTTEQSGLLTLDFGNKLEFGIRANFWDRPQ